MSLPDRADTELSLCCMPFATRDSGVLVGSKTLTKPKMYVLESNE